MVGGEWDPKRRGFSDNAPGRGESVDNLMHTDRSFSPFGARSVLEGATTKELPEDRGWRNALTRDGKEEVHEVQHARGLGVFG